MIEAPEPSTHRALASFASELGCSHSSKQVLNRKKDMKNNPLDKMLPDYIFRVPCLSVKKNTNNMDNVSDRMRKSIQFDSSNISTCPVELLVNTSHAFVKTLDQCTDAAKRCLIEKQKQHSMATDMLKSLKRCEASSIIALGKASTHFRALHKHGFLSKASTTTKRTEVGENDRVVFLPLVFAASFELVLLGQRRVAVCVRCPGTISCGHGVITIDFDTDRLYSNMKEQCKKVVREMLVMLRSNKTAPEKQYDDGKKQLLESEMMQEKETVGIKGKRKAYGPILVSCTKRLKAEFVA